LLYQSTVYRKLASIRSRRIWSYSFFSSVLSCSFLWRNFFLVASSLSVEFRKTRYHYRFFKLFEKFLRLFISSRVTITNFFLRASGCFGGIDRSRSVYLRPLARFHLPLDFQSITSYLRFSFRHIKTPRGLFGLAIWIT